VGRAVGATDEGGLRYDANARRAVGGRSSVRGCTWYFRLLLKEASAGVIVGARSRSEPSDPTVTGAEASLHGPHRLRSHTLMAIRVVHTPVHASLARAIPMTAGPRATRSRRPGGTDGRSVFDRPSQVVDVDVVAKHLACAPVSTTSRAWRRSRCQTRRAPRLTPDSRRSPKRRRSASRRRTPPRRRPGLPAHEEVRETSAARQSSETPPQARPSTVRV
jgi:hypothetical protein